MTVTIRGQYAGDVLWKVTGARRQVEDEACRYIIQYICEGDVQVFEGRKRRPDLEPKFR